MSKKSKPEPNLLAAPISYSYYITYKHAGGFGCSARIMTYPLNNWDRIKITADMIRKENRIKTAVIITNWILL